MSENKKIPEIRFKGFSGEWDHKKLQDLTEAGFSNGVFNDPQKVGKGYRLINVKDMYSGDSINIENLSLLDLDEKEFKKNKVEYGDIFFTRSSLVKEGIAYSNVNLSDRNDITFDGHLIRMQPCKATTNPVFLAYSFKTPSAREQFILGGKTTTMTTIGQSDIATVALSLPCKQEQTKISTIFQNLNTLINQHQQKHDKLSNIKKAMLEKMFPKQGETSPEIRFKEFSGDWDEKELGEIGDTFTGLAGKTKDDFGHGQGRFVTYMNVFSNAISNQNLVEPVEIDKNQNEVEKGDVFFTTSSETPEEVGMSSVWMSDTPNMYLNSFCFGYRPKQKIDSYFLAYILRTRAFRKQVVFLAQGVSRYNISKTKVMDIKIFIPSSSEQEKIGNYFQKLDALINQHQQQITKLKNIKQACLNKMFV
ncbi:restriction endonuclease [Pseudoalteromonas lipolytica SCSIO 04301]|uniref:restriction endonuclease subunit S n=1 Tax=Pseudoalteromonas lipolytica TaxID=570156 RepID=UPI00044A00C3|nr:restriction endonuclease subunit S [Pseudoalteromonas lipolytica]EWH04387.1 restriction endonuclease [Pseudoalteromonas lipolytica SCSIO 04301]